MDRHKGATGNDEGAERGVFNTPRGLILSSSSSSFKKPSLANFFARVLLMPRRPERQAERPWPTLHLGLLLAACPGSR